MNGTRSWIHFSFKSAMPYMSAATNSDLFGQWRRDFACEREQSFENIRSLMSTRPVVDSLMPLDWNMAAKTRFLADRMLTWPPTLLPPSMKENWTSQNDWLRNKFLNCRRILLPVEHSWIGLHFIQNKQINSGDCELLSRLAWNLPDFPRFPFVELRVFLQLDFITSIYIGKYLQDLVTIIRSHQSSIDVYLDLRQLRSSAETGFGAQTPFPFPHLLQEEERR